MLRRPTRTARWGAVAALAVVALAACRPVTPPPPPEPLAPASPYASSARCDGPQPAPTGGPTTVHLVGNSVANEMSICLGTILARKGATVKTIANPGAAMCDLFPAVDSHVLDLPQLVIIFGWHGGTVDQRPCMGRAGQPPLVQWVNDTKEIVDRYSAANSSVRVLLVPQPVRAGHRGVDPVTAPYASNIANPSGGRVKMGDVGKFLRQANLWTWRAVCTSGEVGCAADGAITVRMAADGGVHFCREPFRPPYGTGTCPAPNAGGERRASASIAATALTLLP